MLINGADPLASFGPYDWTWDGKLGIFPYVMSANDRMFTYDYDSAAPSDTTPPTVLLSTPLTYKMSDESGKDSYSYSFQPDEAVQAWKIKVVASTDDPHTAGTLVESGGAAAADEVVAGSITYAELVTAGVGSEGDKVLAFFVQDLAGNWSTTT